MIAPLSPPCAGKKKNKAINMTVLASSTSPSRWSNKTKDPGEQRSTIIVSPSPPPTPKRKTNQFRRNNDVRRRVFEIENLVNVGAEDSSSSSVWTTNGINIHNDASANGGDGYRRGDDNNDIDDDVTVSTVKLNICSEAAIKQKEEVENLIQSTQNMADIIASLGIINENNTTCTTPTVVTPPKTYPLSSPFANSIGKQDDTNHTPVTADSSIISEGDRVIDGNIEEDMATTSPQHQGTPKFPSPPATPKSSTTSKKRQHLYNNLQNEKDTIEHKMMEMAILLGEETTDRGENGGEGICNFLNNAASGKEKDDDGDIHSDCGMLLPPSPLRPIPADAAVTPTRITNRGMSSNSILRDDGLLSLSPNNHRRNLQPWHATTEDKLSTIISPTSTPSRPTNGRQPGKFPSPKPSYPEHKEVGGGTDEAEPAAGTLIEEEGPTIDLVASSVSSEQTSDCSRNSSSSVTYSTEVLKQQHEVDDVVRNTESMAEALRELEEMTGDGQADNNNNDVVYTASSSAAAMIGDYLSGASPPSSPIHSGEARKQNHAMDDIVLKTESMAEALKELERANIVESLPSSPFKTENSGELLRRTTESMTATLQAVEHAQGGEAEFSRYVSLDVALERARTLFRRPKGPLIVRRRRQRSLVEVKTRLFLQNMSKQIIVTLGKHRFLALILIAALITYSSSSQTARGFERTSSLLIQQLAIDTCEQFTI